MGGEHYTCEDDKLFDLKYMGCNFPYLVDCQDRNRRWRGTFIHLLDCAGQFVMTVMRTVSKRQLLQLWSIARFISAHKMDSSVKQNVPTIIVDVLVGLVSYNIVLRVSFGIVMNRLVTIHVWLMVGLVVQLNKHKQSTFKSIIKENK